jgi:anti-anti-sigma factor
VAGLITTIILIDLMIAATVISLSLVLWSGFEKDSIGSSTCKSMIIQKNAHGNTHEVILTGRCDGEGANQLEIALLNSISAGAKTITVDMSGVSFLCSAGLRALLQYWRQLHNKGGSLQVEDPSAEAMTVLGTSGFKSMLIQHT